MALMILCIEQKKGRKIIINVLLALSKSTNSHWLHRTGGLAIASGLRIENNNLGKFSAVLRLLGVMADFLYGDGISP